MPMPIAMIPLAKGAKLTMSDILHHFVSTWPRLPRPVDAKKSDHTLSFSVGGSTVFFALMPGPIPSRELNKICTESWLWPDAKKVFADHHGHVVITIKSKETPLNQVKFLSLATAALLMSCHEALGVYWCGGQIVISSEMFREFCVKMLPDSLPLYIWVDFRVSKPKSGRTFGYTTGLMQFGLMEIETLTSHEEPADLRERIFRLAVYVIENGMIFKNGEFIDEGATVPIKVVYSDSAFGNPKKVLRLDYTSAAKPSRSH